MRPSSRARKKCLQNACMYFCLLFCRCLSQFPGFVFNSNEYLHGAIRGACMTLYLFGVEQVQTRLRECRLHAFGHIHEGYGVTADKEGRVQYVNASSCTLRYAP